MCQKIFRFWGHIWGFLRALISPAGKKQRDMLNDKTEGDVCRTEMIIDPLYLV